MYRALSISHDLLSFLLGVISVARPVKERSFKATHSHMSKNGLAELSTRQIFPELDLAVLQIAGLELRRDGVNPWMLKSIVHS